MLKWRLCSSADARQCCIWAFCLLVCFFCLVFYLTSLSLFLCLTGTLETEVRVGFWHLSLSLSPSLFPSPCLLACLEEPIFCALDLSASISHKTCSLKLTSCPMFLWVWYHHCLMQANVAMADVPMHCYHVQSTHAVFPRHASATPAHTLSLHALEIRTRSGAKTIAPQC